MNLPNKLTVLRLIMVPVFFIAYKIASLAGDAATMVGTILMLICYATAEVSDFLDGRIARKHNLVTDLGKVMDPYTDTLSHLTYFVCFIDMGLMPAWAFVIIMWREFSIIFLRMLMMRTGKALPANIWGKSKTVLYAVSAFAAIVYVGYANISGAAFGGAMVTVLYVLFSLSAIASLLSFITYGVAIIKSKALSGMTR